MKATIAVPDGTFAGVVTATITDAEVPPNGNEGAGIWAQARCYQESVLVYAQFTKVVDGLALFSLGPTLLWVGGDAEGVAAVGYWTDNFSRFRELADTTFHVDG